MLIKSKNVNEIHGQNIYTGNKIYFRCFHNKYVRLYFMWSFSNLYSQVTEKCLSLGAQKALFIPADMSSESDPDKVIDFAVKKLGGLDYLVLNHIGVTRFAMWNGDVDHVRWLMKVMESFDCLPGIKNQEGALMFLLSLFLGFIKPNFFSYIQMAWRALPTLEQSKGSLVIVSSIAGKVH